VSDQIQTFTGQFILALLRTAPPTTPAVDEQSAQMLQWQRMTQDPAVMPRNDREDEFTTYRNVYDWALGILSQRMLSAESAHDFVRDETPTGMDHVLRRLNDTTFALSAFIKVFAQSDTSLKTRSEQLLSDIKDLEHKARKMKETWLAQAPDIDHPSS
jgi:hypothetical protein